MANILIPLFTDFTKPVYIATSTGDIKTKVLVRRGNKLTITKDFNYLVPYKCMNPEYTICNSAQVDVFDPAQYDVVMPPNAGKYIEFIAFDTKKVGYVWLNVVENCYLEDEDVILFVVVRD